MKLHRALLAAMLYFHAATAFAGKGTKLPWESPLEILTRSLTGPVAMAISLVALVICGWALIAGGDMGDFGRRAIMVILAISLLVSGTAIMKELFGVSAALI